MVVKVFDVILKGAWIGIGAGIEKGIMVMIRTIFGIETLIDLEIMIEREKEDMSVHVIMIEQGIVSWIEIEIKTEIWRTMSKNIAETMTRIGKETMI